MEVEFKFQMPADLKARLDAIAQQLTLSASSLVRLAIVEFARKYEQTATPSRQS